MKKLLPFFLFFFVISAFFYPFIFQNKLPIPADTIVGLYHPFRDLYSKDYPRGVPFKNFLITDPVRQQYPFRSLAIEMEKRAVLPLWNPYNMSGTPLLASMQSAAFYPFNIIFFIFSFSIAWSFIVILQPFLAGIFLYLYLNNLKLRKSASFLGAITFAFSGFATAWLEWGTIVHTALWLPLVLLSIDKINFYFINSKIFNFQFSIFNKKTRNNKLIIWSLVLVFSLVSSLFAGHLQTFFYLFLVSSIYFFARWWQFGKSKNILLFFALCSSLFALLTSIQWLPAAQFILRSARNVDQSWLKEGWFIPWQNLLQFFAPDLFGNPTTLNYWGIWNYVELVGYVGILPLVMAFFAIASRKDKKTLFFSILLFLSLLFSLPTFFAKIPYILQIPFLSSSQPTRLLFIIDFCLAVLTAFGFDLFLKNSKKKQIAYPLILTGVIFMGLWIFVFGGQNLLSISSENIMVAKRNLYFPTLIFISLGSILVLSIFVKNKYAKYAITMILITIAVADILRFSNKFTTFSNRGYLFPTPKSIEYLQGQTGQFRIMATDSRILPPNFSIMYRLQTIDGYDPLYLLRYGELIAAMERGKPDIASPFGFNRIITPHNAESRLIDLMGVKYVLSLTDISSVKLEKVFIEGQTRVYKNNRAFDRAFFVENIITSVNKKDTIKKMFDPNVDFKSMAIVEGFDYIDGKFTEGLVNNIQYIDNDIVLDVKNENDGFLVVMDTFYPTWKAKVCTSDGDCKKTKIYLTNYNFRGIIVPRGTHKIFFENNLL